MREKLQNKLNYDNSPFYESAERGLNNLISEAISSKPAVVDEALNQITKDQVVADLERALVISPQRVTLLALNYKDDIKISYPYPYYHNGSLSVQKITDLAEFEKSKTQAN